MSGPSFVLNKTGLAHSYLEQSVRANSSSPSYMSMGLLFATVPTPPCSLLAQSVSCLLVLLCSQRESKGSVEVGNRKQAVC